MRNKKLIYFVFIFMSAMLSVGAVIAAFTDEIPQEGAKALLSAVPLTFIMLGCAWVNYKILIPRYLLPQKYILYVALCFLMAMLIPISGLGLEALIRRASGLTDRIGDYLSPWLLVDSFSTASLLMVIMLGMGVAEIYSLWRKEVFMEKSVADDYRRVIESYRNKINPDEILASLSRIKSGITVNPEESNQMLRALSEKLRRNLYDLPKVDVSVREGKATAPVLRDFISAKRYAFLRDILLKLLLAAVSITAIFETADRPNLTIDGLKSFLGMFLVFCLITYGTKSLCRHFLNRGKIREFIRGCAVFIMMITIVAVTVETYSYVHTIHNGALPLGYSVMATISTLCTIALFLGGIISLTMLHNWLCTESRVQALETETLNTEMQFLKSQINPHFLFNVLNNTGILMYELPDMAEKMLSQLREMFRYQFSITDKATVCLRDEVDFLRNYLLLEQSRKSPYNFDMDVEIIRENIEIPPLLLIPFVENASKYSTGSRDISIKIVANEGYMWFICSNLQRQGRMTPAAKGGIGISNTRRRLDLLFGGDYILDVKDDGNIYSVYLKIPLK